jgi:ComF family protein
MPRARELSNLAVRWLLNPRCAGCRAPLEHPLESPICTACANGIVPLAPPCCERCGDRLAPEAVLAGEGTRCVHCLQHPPAFDVAAAAGVYAGPLREMIHAFKYERRRSLAIPLAAVMRARGHHLLEDADAVVPVPLHPVRSLRRGFNQADDLARGLGHPVWRALRRRRHGPPQASLHAGSRRHNLEGAYGISIGWAIRERARPTLTGRTVVLVDDVMTTGATLDGCARVLLEAGVTSVRALTAARAVEGPPPRPLPPPPPSTPRRR